MKLATLIIFVILSCFGCGLSSSVSSQVKALHYSQDIVENSEDEETNPLTTINHGRELFPRSVESGSASGENRTDDIVEFLQCRVCSSNATVESSSFSCFLEAPPDNFAFRSSVYPCQCDILCQVYGDCCDSALDSLPECESFVDPETGHSHTPNVNAPYTCQSLVINSATPSPASVQQAAVYMISQCPSWWVNSSDYGTLNERETIQFNCIHGPSIPPFSDSTTGRIYRNDFCALCNNISFIVPWRYLLACTVEVRNAVLNGTITIAILEEQCLPQGYFPPSFYMRPPPQTDDLIEYPRNCTPAISTCLSREELNQFLDVASDYDTIREGCENSSYSLVEGYSFHHGATVVFRNTYCAICNGLHLSSDISCFNSSLPSQPPGFANSNSTNTTLVLDPFNGALFFFESGGEPITFIEFNCSTGEIYDVVEQECQFVTCYSVNATCVTGSPLMNDRDTTMDDVTTDVPTFGFVCFSQVVLEDSSQYVMINDFLVFYNPLITVVPIVGLNENGFPIVCLDNADLTILELIGKFARLYNILITIVSVFSIIVCILVILVYSLLRVMRSVFGAVMINLAVTFILGDVSLILGGPAAYSSESHDICVFAAIFEHFLAVAQFVWLSILAFDVILRYYRNVKELPPRSKIRVIIIYLGVGWSIPLILTLLGVIGSFVMDNKYGENGNCHISNPIGSLFLFGIPNMVSVILGAIAMVVVLVILCKNSFKFECRDKCRFALLFAFFLIMLGLALFWFLILSTSIVSLAARFVFIVVVAIRSIYFFVTFVLTKKVYYAVLVLLGVKKKSNKIIPSVDPQLNVDDNVLQVPSLPRPIPSAPPAQNESVKPNPSVNEVYGGVRITVTDNRAVTEENEVFLNHLENPALVPKPIQAWN